jgi:ribosomal protein S18 acetylase RimI-like enzyme
MIVRPATPTDLATLEALFEEVDAYHRVRLPDRFRAPQGPARAHDHLLGLVQGPDCAVLLAEDGRDALGFVTVQVRDTPAVPVYVPRRIGVIDSLGVRERTRRQGVGRVLMVAAEAWVGERGADDLELTVPEANREAVAFYEALGYRLLSRRMSRKLPT